MLNRMPEEAMDYKNLKAAVERLQTMLETLRFATYNQALWRLSQAGFCWEESPC